MKDNEIEDRILVLRINGEPSPVDAFLSETLRKHKVLRLSNPIPSLEGGIHRYATFIYKHKEADTDE